MSGEHRDEGRPVAISILMPAFNLDDRLRTTSEGSPRSVTS